MYESIYTLTVSSSEIYTKLKTGLDTLAKEDEPTLIVFPDAYELSDLTIYNDALEQCNKLQDRFLIMDVKTNDDTEADASTFRNAVTSEYVQYGAAYYPDVNTNLVYSYDEASQTIAQTFEHVDDTSVSLNESYSQAAIKNFR